MARDSGMRGRASASARFQAHLTCNFGDSNLKSSIPLTARDTTQKTVNTQIPLTQFRVRTKVLHRSPTTSKTLRKHMDVNMAMEASKSQGLIPTEQEPDDATSPEAVSNFKALPGEIRNKIYSYCHTGVVTNIAHAEKYPGLGSFTGIAQVFPDCEQELLDFYYTKNTFMFDARYPKFRNEQAARELLRIWSVCLAGIGNRGAGLLMRLKFYTRAFVANVTMPECRASHTNIECSIRFKSDETSADLMTPARQSAERNYLNDTLEGIRLARGADRLTMADVDQIRLEILGLLLRSRIWRGEEDCVEPLARTPAVQTEQQ